MGIKFSGQNYSDFQTVIANSPFKIGKVYYYYSSGQGFFATAISEDFSSGIIEFGQNTQPSTFNSDYPNAILLNASPYSYFTLI